MEPQQQLCVEPRTLRKFGDDYVTIKGIVACSGPGMGKFLSDYDWAAVGEDAPSARQAYEIAGIKNPRNEPDLVKLHDCFSISKVIATEELLL